MPKNVNNVMDSNFNDIELEDQELRIEIKNVRTKKTRYFVEYMEMAKLGACIKLSAPGSQLSYAGRQLGQLYEE